MQGNDPLEELLKKDTRYPAEAYYFVADALAYTVRQLDDYRHVTGKDLACGARDLPLDCWGGMAKHVLESWRIKSTADFGEIVFNMVDAGLMSKDEADTKDDFRQVYTFAETFDRPGPPELDENGHIRRNLPTIEQQEQITWTPLLEETNFN